MPRVSLRTLLPLAFAPLLLAAGPTAAPVPQDTTTSRYLADLDGTDPSDRLFAARALRSRLRLALRRLEQADPDSLDWMDASAFLDDAGPELVRTCGRLVEGNHAAVPCADMLGLLGGPEAERAVTDRLAEDGPDAPRGRLRRHLERALARMGEAP